MNKTTNIFTRFEKWLDESICDLSPTNAIDVHIDELDTNGGSAQSQLDASIALFDWIMLNMGHRLNGKLIILMIPLVNSKILDMIPPTWESVARQLSKTPPSIYILNTTAFMLPDQTQRYIQPAVIPILNNEKAGLYYQCWRNIEDPLSDGWARDLRIVSSLFIG